jgi:NADH-quinone oxidoreductase subunit G
MALIHIDGKPYEVEDGLSLLDACLALGFNLPYFCWHPALGSVGACRQCAIKQFRDERDTKGAIVMACMTPASNGARISINDPEAVEFRAAVIEWLMVNHPHDCPVCDEGGECHLQDMTVMTGHAYREYRFKKRTHRNQWLGPFINHEMNRCIQCYRCVRYYRDYAGGRDFNVFACHDHVYFGRHRDGALENEFSGNLVEICPTGVFTDRTFKRHYSRKWDLQTAPSVCVHCSLGCNTIPGERYGVLRRVRNRYNHAVNGYFLCDRGRYGYEFVNSDRRIRQPLLRKADDGTGLIPGGDSAQEAVSVEEALSAAAALLADGRKVIGIGSPRASVESNFALRTLVGSDHFFAGISEADFDLINLVLNVLQHGLARTPSLHETMDADAVLVLGEDVTNTAPMLALSLRQLVRRNAARIAERAKIPHWHDAAVREVGVHAAAKLFVATPHGTRLDDVALLTYRAAPDDLARLGSAVASRVSFTSPEPPGPSEEERLGRLSNKAILGQAPEAEEIARSLMEVKRPLIVSGTGCGSRAVIQAAADVCRALSAVGRPAELLLALPECNSLGLALLGAAGGLGAAAAVPPGNGGVDTIIVLENDLYRREERERVTALLNSAKHVIAVDHLAHDTTRSADVVLPAATFAECSGTLVNNEGRAQRFYSVFAPEVPVRESWRWLRDLMIASGHAHAGGWLSLDDIVKAISATVPALSRLAEVAPDSGYRAEGGKVPRQSNRYSGRTAMRAHISVHEPKPPEDTDTPLAFSMEGDERRPQPSLIPRFWVPGWNSVQSVNKFQSEIGGPLRGGDPGLRLIEPRPETATISIAMRKSSSPEEGDWQFVPLHHIFGSEELSVLAPAVAERCPRPYLALHPADAAGLGLEEGETVTATAGHTVLELPVRVIDTLPRKVAGVPVGLPGLPVFPLPGRGTISKREDNE